MNRVGFFDILGKRRWDQIALQEWQTIDLALDTAGIGRCATVLVHFTDLNEVARLSGEKPITDSERTPAMKNYLRQEGDCRPAALRMRRCNGRRM